MIKTILFPTDFSSTADNALDYASYLAEKLHAKIILHHSCHVPAFASQVPLEEFSEEKILNDASSRIKVYANRLVFKNKNIAIEEYINFDFAVDSIISTAKEKKADLIVMGTKGSSGVEAALIGSNAASVMEKAPCPVLAIPGSAAYSGLQRIIFATDYRENDIQSISELAEMAGLFNSEILIVHMCELGHADGLQRDEFKKFQDKVIAAVSYPNLSFQFLVGLNEAFVLNTAVEQSKADVLAMSMRKRNFVSTLFEKSLTKKMTYHSSVPILAFHS